MRQWLSLPVLVLALAAGCSGSSSSPSHRNPGGAVESQLRAAGWTVVASQGANRATCGGRASLRVDAQDRALAGGQGLAYPHLTVWKLSTPRAAMVCELFLLGQRGFRSGPLTTRPLKLRVLSRQSEYVDYAGAYLLLGTTSGSPPGLLVSLVRARSRLRSL